VLTDYTLSVEESLLAASGNESVEKNVTLTYWGGTIDGETQTLSDLRLPSTGERVVVMLRSGWRTAGSGFTPVVGFNQGLLSVSTDANGRAMVRDHAGQPLALTEKGQVLRGADKAKAAVTAGTSDVDLDSFKQWVRSNAATIKSKPSEMRRVSDSSDPRVMPLFAKTPGSSGPPTKAGMTAQPDASKAVEPSAAGFIANSPTAPASGGQVITGSEQTMTRQVMSPQFAYGHYAHLPIVVNNFPASFSPWSPEDQYEMSRWNYYASGVFRVYTTPTGTYGWGNGVFDLAGWPSSTDLQNMYGSGWDAITIGVTFLRYDSGGWIIEADIALNPAFSFTLDDEWVYNGGSAQPFRQVMTHELGHMHGLNHQFNFLSVMNYMPANFRFFGLPYMDDAAGIRSEYPGNAVSLTDLGIYLYYESGYQSVSDATMTRSVNAGGTLTVNNYHLENVGTTTVGTPTVEWYLTSGRNFSSTYYYLGSSTYSSLSPFNYFTPSTVQRSFTVPTTVAAGNYYLAALIRNDSGVGQSSFPFNNNMAFSRQQVSVSPPAVPNDQCYGAIALSSGTTYTMSTANANATGDPTPVCGYGVTKGVWFSFTPSGSGPVGISTCDSDFDTVLQVYSGSCGSLSPVACDDDYGPYCQGLQASVQFNANGGTTYLVFAGGYGGGSGNLSVTAYSPANDACSAAVPLAAGTTYSMDTSDATATGDPTPVCGYGVTKGVWFSFTPTTTAPVAISTCGSSFDTVLQAYTGTCGSLTPVICDDDYGPSCQGLQASVQFMGSAYTTYLIFTGGYEGASGNLNIVANSASLSMSSVSFHNGQPQCTINGPAGASCVIEVSSDLVHWVELGTYTIPANGALTINDPNSANYSSRFYRSMIRDSR
jgi:hypothetical protein